MKENNILEVEISKKIDCSKEVALWNYWDHEHLDVIHQGYKESDILYDKKNFMFRVDKIKVPFPFLKITTPVFMVQHDDNTLIVYAVQLGVISKTTITIKSVNDSSCEINMNYKFYLNGWRKILKPFLKIMIPKWNEKVCDYIFYNVYISTVYHTCGLNIFYVKIYYQGITPCT